MNDTKNIKKLLKEGKNKISGLRLNIESNDRLIDTASQNLKKKSTNTFE